MLTRSYTSTAAAIIATLTVVLSAPTANAAGDDALTDSRLASCARDALGLADTDPLTADAVASLEELYCDEYIVSLDGLEAATGLTVLALWHSAAVSDLTPLTGLEALQFLGLEELRDIDLSPISTLTSLEALDLDSATVTELPDLSVLPAFQELNISSTDITDLTPLAGVDSLTVLWAEDTWISDLSPLSGHDALEELAMAWSEVDDLSPLAGLPSLASVDMYANSVMDASPLATLPALAAYDVDDQYIDGGTMARCTVFDTPVAIGLDGASLVATSSSAYRFGDQTLLKPSYTGSATLTFDSGDGFSGSLHYDAPSQYTWCEWPDVFAATASISGKPVQGSTLTASLEMSQEPEPTSPTVSYAWYDGSTDELLGTGATYEPDEFDVGRTIVVKATISLGGMQDYETTSAAVGPVLGAFPGDATVKIVNTPVVGTNPSAQISNIEIGRGYDVRYIWSLDGKTVSTEAWNGNPTYLIPSSAAGRTLSVTVQVRADGYATRTYEGPSATVLGSFGEIDRVYPLQGSFKVGQTVTAKHQTYSGAVRPAYYTYQWMRSGKPIAGATSSSYKITTADAGHTIKVVITGKRAGYLSSSYTSEHYKVPPLFSSAPTPVITGTPTVGNTLKARVGSWSPSPSTLTYRWYRDGKPITGATGKTYKLTSADAGHKITFKVTAKRNGYTTMTKTSSAVTAKRRLTTATPSIVGTPKVGTELSAKTGTWGPGTVSKKITWYVNGKAVGTGRTYVVQPEDAFKSIKVKVTGTKSGYTTAYKSSATQTVAGKKYTSCGALWKDYPGGVAKSATTKDKVNGVVVSGIDENTFVSSSLYSLNAARDADKDGWACEPPD